MSSSRKISAKNFASPFRKKLPRSGENDFRDLRSVSVPNLSSKCSDFKDITDIKEALPPLDPQAPKKSFSIKRFKWKSKVKREKSYNKTNISIPGSKGDSSVGSRLAIENKENEYTLHTGISEREKNLSNENDYNKEENVGYIGQRCSDVSKSSTESSERKSGYCNMGVPGSPNPEELTLPEYACADEVRQSLGISRPSSDSDSYRPSSESSRDSRDSLTPRTDFLNLNDKPPLPPKPASLRGQPLVTVPDISSRPISSESNDTVGELPPRPPARQVVLKSGRATLPQGLKSGYRRRTTYETVEEEFSIPQSRLEFGLPGELRKLPHQPWYWGPLNQEEAEAKLQGLPDGYFLVRDSSDERYLLSLSFNSNGRPVHTRFEYVNGLFSINDSEGYTSVVELIDEAVRESQNGVFSFMQSSYGTQTFPARLTHWVSRFSEVKSLQYLARFVIREAFPRHYVLELPVPKKILNYILENQY